MCNLQRTPLALQIDVRVASRGKGMQTHHVLGPYLCRLEKMSLAAVALQ